MNFDQITKKYEDYKKGLEQDLHKLDDIKKEVSEELFLLKTETLKSPEKIEIESGQTIKEWENDFEEFYKSAIFPISCILPLQTVIAHFSTKINTLFSSKEINMELDPIVPSSREIYHVIKQLPEEIASLALDGLGTDSLVNAYREGEESFTSVFELLTNKSEIINELVLFVKLVDLGSGVEQVFNINDENTIEAIKFYLKECIASVKEHPDLENTNALFDTFGPEQFISIDHNTSRMSIDSQRHYDYYKQLLFKYIKLSPDFDLYTQQCADKILQNPDYIGITNELLAECEQTIKNESMGEESTVSTKNDELKPLPFPYEIIKIKKDKKRAFLDELYDLLLNPESPDKPYIQYDQKNTFIYLFGGSEEKPSPCIPVLWLRQKNELQAFLLAFFGENAGKDLGWSKLNNYFWLNKENTNPQLANSIGNLSKQAVYTLNKLVKPLIEKYTSNQI